LDAVLLAAALVDSGAARVVIAGGAESYSRRPLRLATDPEGGDPQPYDAPPFTPWPDRDPDMTAAAAALAGRLGISRQAQEDWAFESHRKALAAGNPPEVVALKGMTRDAFARALTPAIARRAKVLAGSITTATAAVAADAAAFVVVARDDMAGPEALRIGPGVTLGALPEEPGLAPVPAIAETLRRAGLAPAALARVELMEAYAVQAIACATGAGLDPARINPAGGALARGHPIGASGAILAVSLFHGLQSGHGLAAIAAAGGLGTAVLFSRQ
ncbi:MAG: thiolase family protein, partial [Rhodobacteraceae bacterium]|nr:thiolase family protein [Paracoccaceae bacterium]